MTSATWHVTTLVSLSSVFIFILCSPRFATTLPPIVRLAREPADDLALSLSRPVAVYRHDIADRVQHAPSSGRCSSRGIRVVVALGSRTTVLRASGLLSCVPCPCVRLGVALRKGVVDGVRCLDFASRSPIHASVHDWRQHVMVDIRRSWVSSVWYATSCVTHLGGDCHGESSSFVLLQRRVFLATALQPPSRESPSMAPPHLPVVAPVGPALNRVPLPWLMPPRSSGLKGRCPSCLGWPTIFAPVCP